MNLTEDSGPSLRLLGTLSLRAGGEQRLGGRRKPLLFLAFVACHGEQGVSRAAAMEVLWGDRSEARARQSVRQALLLLRNELGDVLHVDRNRIRLRPGTLRVDVLELEATLEWFLEASAAPASDPGSSMDPLAGMELEPGGLHLLPGVDTEAPTAFLHWLDAERAALDRRIRRWFRQELEDAAARGDRSRVARVARLWSGAGPLDEVPMGAALEVLPLLGRGAEALQLWREWSSRYGSDTGEPPPETLVRAARKLELARADLGGGGNWTSSSPQAEMGEQDSARRRRGPGSLALFSPDLVERRVVQDRLDAALEAIRSGDGRILALTGPEGIGRSRIVREFLRGLDLEGDQAVLALSTEPLPPGEESPLGAVRALLRPLPGAPGLGGASDDALAQVAGLVPELRTRFPRLPDPATPTPTHLGPALASVLEAVAQEVPIVLVVDDLPDLDAESRQVMVELLRTPVRGTLVLVTSDEDPARPASGLLQGTTALERIEVPPISPAGAGDLLRSMMILDPAILEPLARRLHGASSGNPLLFIAMVHAVADSGALTPGPDGVWRLEGGDPDTVLPLLEGLPATLSPRWSLLSLPLRRVLEALAVLGGPVPATRLSAVAGLSPDAFDAALDGLLARRMVREVPTPVGPAHLDFPHASFRRAAYDAMNPRRREELHGRAAATLLREAQLHPRLRPLVADHLARSGHLAAPEDGGRGGVGRGVRAAVALLVSALLLVAWFSLGADPGDDDLVAIFPFEVVADPELDWMGVGVADLLAAGLDGVGGIRTVDRHALSAVLPPGEISASEARRLARRLGAGTWILGRVVGIEGDVVLQASLYRGRSRVGRVDGEQASASSVVQEVDRLARFLLPFVVAGDAIPRLDLATRTTGSIRALRHFVEGEHAFRAGRYETAIEAYEAATALDPDFALAHLRTALALEWSGAAPASRISASLAAADASRSRLPRKERRLLAAVMQYHRGFHLEAVESLRGLLAEEPDFVDAWFTLAEVLFHTLPRTGDPEALPEAHRVLLQVLALSPDHREALLHLPRTALHLGDVDAAEAALRRLRATELADRPILFTSEVFVAWARQDRVEMDRLDPLLTSVPPLLVLVSGAFLTVYARRPDLAANLASRLDHPLRPGEVRGTGWLWTSAFLRAAGDLPESDAALREAARWLPAEALRLEALFLLAPEPEFAVDAQADVDAERRDRVLAGLQSGSMAPFPGTSPGVHGGYPSDGLPLPWPAPPSWTAVAASALDVYLVGLHLAARGEGEEARRHLQLLDSMAPGTGNGPAGSPAGEEAELIEALRRGLAADLLRREGRPDEALQVLRELHLGGWHQAAFGSPYFALPRERRLMGILLRETGSGEEAERWMRSLASATPFDGIWPQPSRSPAPAGRVRDDPP
jgi:DNA-binding SARP family transcriptional activator/thioredoxin-like negative regulator of GroEL